MDNKSKIYPPIITSENVKNHLRTYAPVLIIIIIAIVLYFVISGLTSRPTPAPTPPIPTLQAPSSSISSNLASIIAGTLTNSTEYFTPFPYLDNNQQLINNIAMLLEQGNLAAVERLILSHGINLTDINKKLVGISEVLNPAIIKDTTLQDIITVIKSENEISEISNEINFLTNSLTAINPTTSTYSNITSDISRLNTTMNQFQEIINNKQSLSTLLANITDPDKLSHILEIQLKIQNNYKKRFIDRVNNYLTRYFGVLPTQIPGLTRSPIPNTIPSLISSYINNYNSDDLESIKSSSTNVRSKPSRIEITRSPTSGHDDIHGN